MYIINMSIRSTYPIQPRTMKNIFKAGSISRVEKQASILACEHLEEWMKEFIREVLDFSEGGDSIKGEHVISALKTVPSIHLDGTTIIDSGLIQKGFPFYKKRLLYSAKMITGKKRWTLSAKDLLNRICYAYLSLVTERLETTLMLANQRTVTSKFVKACINLK
jgi:histone H3/H4